MQFQLDDTATPPRADADPSKLPVSSEETILIMTQEARSAAIQALLDAKNEQALAAKKFQGMVKNLNKQYFG